MMGLDMDLKCRPPILNTVDPPNPQNKPPHKNLAVQKHANYREHDENSMH